MVVLEVIYPESKLRVIVLDYIYKAGEMDLKKQKLFLRITLNQEEMGQNIRFIEMEAVEIDASSGSDERLAFDIVTRLLSNNPKEHPCNAKRIY